MNNISESITCRSTQRTKMRGWGLLFILPIFPVLTGCGTDFSQLLLQSSATVGQTAIDLLLTDLTNQLADALDQAINPPAPGGGAGGDTGGGTGGDTGGGTNIDDLTGDAPAGSAVFASNSCGSCHCDDAVGGCALSAPSLIGVSLDLLDTNLRGSDAHPIKLDLTDQEIVDLQAWLSSL